MSTTGPTTAALGESLTERLAQMQQQLESLRTQLTESQRLATIGTISAVIAHEFNNLLTPIVSYSQYALQSAQSDQPDMELIKKALSKSFQSADKAGKICQSMLGLARGQSVFADVAVQKLVDETLLVMARDPRKDGIAVRVQIEPELAVFGDPVQLEQVLLNLMINARQAMLGRGGALTIKGFRNPSQPEVLVQVIYNGPGIPEKLLPRIF